jgi:hypothetical protein
MRWGAEKGASTTSGSDVFFEFTQIGGQVRVAAIDSRTGFEVVVVAPATATQFQMQNLALAKLKRRLQQGT